MAACMQVGIPLPPIPASASQHRLPIPIRASRPGSPPIPIIPPSPSHFLENPATFHFYSCAPTRLQISIPPPRLAPTVFSVPIFFFKESAPSLSLSHSHSRSRLRQPRQPALPHLRCRFRSNSLWLLPVPQLASAARRNRLWLPACRLGIQRLAFPRAANPVKTSQ